MDTPSDALTQEALIRHSGFVRELSEALLGKGADSQDLEQ